MKARTTLALLAAVAATAVLGAVRADAITYGQVDTANRYDFVGLVLFYDTNGAPLWRCTGTLLSPTVLLTAGHCTSGAASAQVWFDVGPIVPSPGGYPFFGGTTGTPYAHPGFDDFATFPNTSDTGIVVLSKRVKKRAYGTLAPVGFLNSFASKLGLQDRLFTQVGYGLQEIKPVFSAERTRYFASSPLVNVNSANTGGWNVQFGNNPGDGNSIGGGTCFGDSGGPAFDGDSNVVVAVTSFGMNNNCKGADFSYRVDTIWAQGFITGFLR
jgi:V8-like Glu-specific endopeptidase